LIKGVSNIFSDILLPANQNLQLTKIQLVHNTVELTIKATSRGANCPKCGLYSNRQHSYYFRQLDDLPVSGQAVLLRWQVRRFFCSNSVCPKGTFAEQLNEFAQPYAHRTSRQAQNLVKLGLALGGKAGERLAYLIGMPVSDSTLLRLLDQLAGQFQPKLTEPLRVVGVDDFAWRRGTRYGTILVDLEKHRVLDLLADRSAESLANWLEKYPTIEVVSRDRAGVYADGTNRGAPQAVQVADRFHLLMNLGVALERFFERKGVWKLVVPVTLPVVDATATARPRRNGTELREGSKTITAATKPSNWQSAKATNRQKRLATYHQILELQQQGLSGRRIASRLKLNRHTVGRYLKAEQFPEKTYRTRSSQLDRYKQYLRQRWDEGQHNAKVLWGEIQTRGFSGSIDVVRRYVQVWRTDLSQAEAREKAQQHSKRPLSIKAAAKLILSDNTKLKTTKAEELSYLRQWDQEVEKAYQLTQAFKRLIRERPGRKAYEEWLKLAQGSGLVEIANFAKGLKGDEEAVIAGLTLPYSNGQTEGQINRLKLIKRSMFGRAKFELLRTRVLAA